MPDDLDGRFGQHVRGPTVAGERTGRSQVELFMPANADTQRSTLVTIAGQTASITQAGR
jgi:hypothetical protein